MKQTVAPLWFAPDARVVATINRNGAVQYWEVATRHPIRIVPPVVETINESLRMAVAPDGKTLAIGPVNAAIELWNLERRERIATLRYEKNEDLGEVLFSPDQRWLVSAHLFRPDWQRSETRLWNVATRQVAARFPSGGNLAAFSPDSKILATVGTAPTVRLWDIATHREFRTLESAGGHRSLAFSPDGKLLASGEGQFVTRVWEVTSGNEIAVLSGHRGGIFDVAFSPDGKTLATGSTDDTVKFWNTATWQEVMTLPDFGKNVGRLLFSPDGATLAVGNGFFADERGPVQLWRAPSLADIAAAEVLAAPKP